MWKIIGRFLWQILKDERGIDPLTAGAIAAGGGALIGSIFGKKKRKTEVIDPYAKERTQLKGYLSGKLGQKTPYQYDPQFEIPQPGVEREAEQLVRGRMAEPVTPQMYSADITGKHYEARKARLGERHEEEIGELQGMYNRLGLVSSTPGLSAQTKLRRQHGQELEDISSGLMYEDIQRELEGTRMAEDITQGRLGQGLGLGAAQRGYGQFATQMSMEDLMRQMAEEQNWAQQMGGFIGQPTYLTSQQPNTASKLGGAAMDIGSLLMMQGMGKTTPKTNPTAQGFARRMGQPGTGYIR